MSLEIKPIIWSVVQKEKTLHCNFIDSFQLSGSIWSMKFFLIGHQSWFWFFVSTISKTTQTVMLMTCLSFINLPVLAADVQLTIKLVATISPDSLTNLTILSMSSTWGETLYSLWNTYDKFQITGAFWWIRHQIQNIKLFLSLLNPV